MAEAQRQSESADAAAQARQALDNRDYDAALRLAQDAEAAAPGDAAALALLGEIHGARGDTRQAALWSARAVLADEADLTHKRQFLRLGGAYDCKHYEAELERAVLVCLQTLELDFAGADTLWWSVLLLKPQVRLLATKFYWRFFRRNYLGARENLFAPVRDFSALLEPYFLRGIRKNVMNIPVFETLMTDLRHFLLGQLAAESPCLTAASFLALAAAVAQYAFHTDYILDVTDEEQQHVESLRDQVATGATPSPAVVAVLAAYMPLYALANAAALARDLAAVPELAETVQEQITEYRQLQDRARVIAALTPVDDDVSAQVRAQYEEFPYPRWREMEPQAAQVTDVARLSRMNAAIHTCLSRPQAQVLIAGCGTGREAAHLGRAFPNAAILAIDITRASLAYAAQKAETYGVRNIAFGQADILQLETSGRQFDYIASFGVLHHMRDPEAGWAVLNRLLKPGGLMHIGLYSATARRAIAAAREAIAKGQYPATAEGMRRFRKDSPKLLRKPVLQALTRMHDYYYLNMYRDLLFHVQEHRFDILRIKADLQHLGLEFLGFKAPPAVAGQYLRLFPDDPRGVDLDHWHEFEQRYPDTFLECYSFWCRKPE